MSDPTPLYHRALAAWGAEAQMDMLHEEIGELLMTLGHFKRTRASMVDVASEIADVGIMLEQAAIIVGCVDQVEDLRRAKLSRLTDRLDAMEAQERRKMEPL